MGGGTKLSLLDKKVEFSGVVHYFEVYVHVDLAIFCKVS